MRIRYPFRLTLITLFVLCSAGAIVIQILNILNSNEFSAEDEFVIEITEANRGNIYTANNKLLAVTTSKYDIRFDAIYAKSVNSASELEELANDLSQIFNTNLEYEKDINTKTRYALLKRNASFEEVKQIKRLPYYNKSLHGGLIVKAVLSREKPNGNTAARTIGDLYKNNTPKYGLEYSYNTELMGQDGKALFLKKPGAGKIKIKDSNNLNAIDGKDLITTLDLDYQDILENALLRQLEIYDASFGTAILMDVKTGKIKAITNLKKIKENKYGEILNFGVTRQVEPGSTMKLASIMAYFEDCHGDVKDTIDCKNGRYRFKGAPIFTKDSKKLGVVTIEDAFVHSSNIGIGRLIHKNYKKNPQKFIDRLYSFGLGERSKIDLSGVPSPTIPSPSDNSWSGISLPWISFGYGVHLTPLDILTFYNAVANNGYLVYPYLGESFRQGSELIPIPKDRISRTICSQSTIEKTQALLMGVVNRGTASTLSDLPFSISGKTGTAVKNYTNYSGNDAKSYQSSFVGFFPSEKPQYSCIVLVDNPNINVGYYGSVVAVPVFQEIAHKIYLKEGLAWPTDYEAISREDIVCLEGFVDSVVASKKNIEHGHCPNVVGLHLRDALNILNSNGYEVIIKGRFGHVKSQNPQPGSIVNKKSKITLYI
ncbi:MAG: hypothetical protein CMP62_05225 [Flavobacteriales bacterium]|nr:hypothetical protein [Flavobacteriales bacterium]